MMKNATVNKWRLVVGGERVRWRTSLRYWSEGSFIQMSIYCRTAANVLGDIRQVGEWLTTR